MLSVETLFVRFSCLLVFLTKLDTEAFLQMLAVIVFQPFFLKHFILCVPVPRLSSMTQAPGLGTAETKKNKTLPLL